MRKLLLFVIPLVIWSCNEPEEAGSKSEVPGSIASADTVQAEEPAEKYGFSQDSFHFYESEIARNDFLSNILSQHGVDYQTIDKIAKASASVYDVRKLRHGKSYCVVSSADSAAQCFIYRPNDIDYVVYDFTNPDSINIYKEQKPVTTKERSVSGVITSSLYQTMQENGVSTVLALKLSEVYAWSIDFYRIQHNDRFKVIFEENFVDGKSVGIGKIKAAAFYHFSKPFYAFHFEEGEVADYYDENGNSLRKAFLKTPVKFSTLTSRYNRTRYHPVLKRVKPHLGTDYAAPQGTPILATGDGVVTEASYTGGNGNYVKIRHNGTYTTQYLHMQKFARGMNTGAKVNQGDVIGYVGSTGLATGPHVCYRFWKNGAQVDPLKEELPPSNPVDDKFKDEYDQHKDAWMHALHSIDWPDNWNKGVAIR